MENLNGQIAVVTGSGRGIGRAIAVELSNQGATTICLARSENKLAETVKLIHDNGGKAEYICTDMTDQKQVSNAVNEIVKKYQKIDVWVNNAGINKALGPTWEIEEDKFFNEIDLNLKGKFLGTKYALLQMIKQNSGRIVNMAGGGVKNAMPYASAYAASKSGGVRFTETVSEELKKEGYNIKVFEYLPGLVKTPATENLAVWEDGLKYLPNVAVNLKEGNHVPAEKSGKAIAMIAKGKVDELSGKMLTVHMDFNAIAHDESIINSDIFTLRMVEQTV